MISNIPPRQAAGGGGSGVPHKPPSLTPGGVEDSKPTIPNLTAPTGGIDALKAVARQAGRKPRADRLLVEVAAACLTTHHTKSHCPHRGH